MTDLSTYLTVTEAARRQGKSRQAVLESISRGTLKATKMGNQWLIRERDLLRFVPHAGGNSKKPRRRKGRP
jgi:excisionase family DNA binding protein